MTQENNNVNSEESSQQQREEFELELQEEKNLKESASDEQVCEGFEGLKIELSQSNRENNSINLEEAEKLSQQPEGNQQSIKLNEKELQTLQQIEKELKEEGNLKENALNESQKVFYDGYGQEWQEYKVLNNDVRNAAEKFQNFGNDKYSNTKNNGKIESLPLKDNKPKNKDNKPKNNKIGNDSGKNFVLKLQKEQ